MIKYTVEENSEAHDYGIYDLLTKGPGLKNLGAISEDTYIFGVGTEDHNEQMKSLTEQLGRFSLILGIKNEDNVIKMFISYADNCHYEPLTLFQYETLIGILKECKKYLIMPTRPLKININHELYPNHRGDRLILCPFDKDIVYEYEKEYCDIKDVDTAIEEIEREIDVLFPHKEIEKQVSKVFTLLPFLKRNNKQ